MGALKKWLVLAVAGGAGFAVACAIILGIVSWYSSRPKPWKADALVVVWSEASETFQFDRKTEGFKNAGFSLTFGLQNNTDRDITLGTDVNIMQRLTKGKTLADYSVVAKIEKPCFVPTSQRAEFSIRLNRGCSTLDLATGKEDQRDPKECYKEEWDGVEGLVLFDHRQRLQVNLPKPALK